MRKISIQINDECHKSSFRHSVLTLDPIDPIPLNLNPILIFELTIAILPVIFPLPFPSPSISIIILSLAILLAVLKPTNVFCFLFNILYFALVALELAVLEITFVDTLFPSVWLEDVHKAESLDVVVQERPLIDEVAFCCCEFALALFATFDKFSLIIAAIGEFVQSFAVGKVFEPLAMVV